MALPDCLTDDRAIELRDLAKYRASALSDDMLAVCYLTGSGEWDRLAQRLQGMRNNIDLMAGLTAQLLPTSKTPDAPEQQKGPALTGPKP